MIKKIKIRNKITKLYLLNFLLLQWFCIRLVRKCKRYDSNMDRGDPTIIINDKGIWIQIGLGIIFVLPLTGWWSDYIWIWRRK